MTDVNLDKCRTTEMDGGKWCVEHHRWSHTCVVLCVNQFTINVGVESVIEHLAQIKNSLTPKLRKQILEAMALEQCDAVEEAKYGWVRWCRTHNGQAKHSNDDQPVCEVFARNEGCQCCPENFA